MTESGDISIVVPGRLPLRGGSALRGLIGLLLAACIFAAAFASQSSYGGAAEPLFPSDGRGGANASNTLGSKSTARVGADSCPAVSRAGAETPDDGERAFKRGARE